MRKDFALHVRVRGENGEAAVLRYNEPRPDLTVRARRSVLVDPRRLGAAGLRLQVEALLARGCGLEQTARVVRLGPEVVPVLIKLARSRTSPGGPQRAGAVTALGHFPHAIVVDYLIEVLADTTEEARVRAQALIALGRIGSPACVARLRVALRQERDPAIRRLAAKALALSRSLEALDDLTEVARRDRNRGVRAQAYASLRTLAKIHRVPVVRVAAPAQSAGGRRVRPHVPAGARRRASKTGGR
jgi:HEAT repeat protein